VRQAAGVPDLDVEILGAVPGWPRAQVAERYPRRPRVPGRRCRPPHAAHGRLRSQHGVQDVHNLAWKLAAVLEGWAGPGSLPPTRTSACPTAARSPSRASSTRARSAAAASSEPGPAGRHAGPARVPERARHDLRRLLRVVGDHPGRHAAARRSPIRSPTTSVRASRRPRPARVAGRERSRLSTLDLFGRGFVVARRPTASPGRCRRVRWRGSSAVPLDAYDDRPAGTSATPTSGGPSCTASAPAAPCSCAPTDTSAGARRRRRTAPRAELARTLRTLLATGS
jgi:putative polyketide hydroxylase